MEPILVIAIFIYFAGVAKFLHRLFSPIKR